MTARPATHLVRAENRFLARRTAGRRRRVVSVAAAVAVVALVSVAVWAVELGSVLAVRSVAVSGVSRLSVTQVRAAADVRAGTPLARVDLGAVRRRVAALAPVASVTVSRRWPHTVAVAVVERRPVVAVATAGRWTLVDADAVPFATVGTPPRGLVRMSTPGRYPGTATPAVAAGVAVWRQLPAVLRGRVTSLVAAGPQDVRLELTGGATVVWGDASDAARKSAVLAALLKARRAHVYDVSAPDVAVVR